MNLRSRLRTGITKPVDLRKHGGSSHDQSTHGNWANGGEPKMRERSRENYRTNKVRRPDLLNLPDTGEIEVTFLSRKVGSLQYKLNRPGDYEILAESYLPEHEEWGKRVAREKLEDPIAKHPGPDGSELHGTGSDQTVHGGHRTVYHGTRWMKGEEILENGWNPEMEGRGLGGVWGKGAYFAPGYEAAESWAGRTGNAVVLQAEIPDDVKILQVQSAGLSPAAISGAYIPTEEGRMDLFRASNPPEVIEMFEEVGRLYDEENVFPTEGVERVVTDAGYQALEVLPGTEEARVEGMEFFSTGGHQLVIYDEAVTRKLKFRVAAPFITGDSLSSYDWVEPDQEPAEWLRELEASSVSKRQRTWFTVVRRNHLPRDVRTELIVKHADHDQSTHGDWARSILDTNTIDVARTLWDEELATPSDLAFELDTDSEPSFEDIEAIRGEFQQRSQQLLREKGLGESFTVYRGGSVRPDQPTPTSLKRSTAETHSSFKGRDGKVRAYRVDMGDVLLYSGIIPGGGSFTEEEVVVMGRNLHSDLTKHGGDSHDQKSHGNWARSSSPSDDLRSNLETIGEQFGSASMGIVAEHGQSYPPPTAERNAQLMSIHAVEPGQMKQCFENAGRHMVDANELTYVEGYAYAAKLEGLPIQHAWLVTPDGEVIDPTWGSHNDGQAPGTAYYGIPIDRDFLIRHLMRTGTWGVFKGVPLEAEVADIVAE